MEGILKWGVIIGVVLVIWSFMRNGGFGASASVYPTPGSPYGYGYDQPYGYEYGPFVAGYASFNAGPVSVWAPFRYEHGHSGRADY